MHSFWRSSFEGKQSLCWSSSLSTALLRYLALSNGLSTVTSFLLVLAFEYQKLPFFSAVQPTLLHVHFSSTSGCEAPP